jgi:nucleotide-binding universal stress UspA family protein
VLRSKARELRRELHSPLRERLFGGATYYVVEHMDLPVLLSR